MLLFISIRARGSTCAAPQLQSTGFRQASEWTGQRCYLALGRMFGEWEWKGCGLQCANAANSQEGRVLTLQI